METRERIIDICHYIGDHEFACPSCGAVNHVEELAIYDSYDKNGKMQWRGDCGHCDTFVRWMPTQKIKSIWWKEAYHTIAEFDTELLLWMIKKQYGTLNNQKYIHAVLLGRLDSHEVPDVLTPRSEQNKLDKTKKLNEELTTLSHNIEKWQADAIAHFQDNSWDASEQEQARKNLVRWKRRVVAIEKLL